jgi:hypothetical protein
LDQRQAFTLFSTKPSDRMSIERIGLTGPTQATMASRSPARVDLVHALATAGEKLRHAASE